MWKISWLRFWGGRGDETMWMMTCTAYMRCAHCSRSNAVNDVRCAAMCKAPSITIRQPLYLVSAQIQMAGQSRAAWVCSLYWKHHCTHMHGPVIVQAEASTTQAHRLKLLGPILVAKYFLSSKRQHSSRCWCWQKGTIQEGTQDKNTKTNGPEEFVALVEMQSWKQTIRASKAVCNKLYMLYGQAVW